jgi:uncharacterized membrane protein YbhN (UPF0104 family)
MIAITVALLWLSLRGIAVGDGEDRTTILWNAWQKADKGYLILMASVMIISHVLRAERWRMLLRPTGNEVTLKESFLSVMIGYLVNLAIPRGGEVSRCYNLFKLRETPVETSFGTVVVERLVDVFCMLLLVALAFVLEWDKLESFMNSLGIGGGDGGKSVSPLLLVGIAVAAGLAALVYAFRNHPKLLKLWTGFRSGMLAVFRVENKPLFILYSVAIWVLYFGMSYTVMLAFDETAHLGMRAVLSIFALGAIAMAAPLPGGAGSYHVLLPLGLTSLYHLPTADAVAFVFIFHAWQTFVLIVGGLVCLIISYWLIRWRRQPQK